MKLKDFKKAKKLIGRINELKTLATTSYGFIELGRERVAGSADIKVNSRLGKIILATVAKEVEFLHKKVKEI